MAVGTDFWVKKGIIGGVGFVDGWLTKRDQDEQAKTPTVELTYFKKQSNLLRAGGTLLGTGLELFMPQYSKLAAPVADASLALLCHGLYVDLTKEEGVVPPISSRRTVFVPRHRVAGSPQFTPPPGPVMAVESGGVPMVPTGPRYE